MSGLGDRRGPCNFALRQHRIILVRRLRSQNFRQIGQKPQAILSVLARIFGRYDGLLCKQDACLELCGVASNKTPACSSADALQVSRTKRRGREADGTGHGTAQRGTGAGRAGCGNEKNQAGRPLPLPIFHPSEARGGPGEKYYNFIGSDSFCQRRIPPISPFAALRFLDDMPKAGILQSAGALC